jgi:hypothetical protein
VIEVGVAAVEQVLMPPSSMCLMSAALAALFRVRSALRASGGTASTDEDRSAKVTAWVFTANLSVRRSSSLLLQVQAELCASK